MARASRVDLHGVIACIGHLAGDEAAPDQLVQPVLLARQVCLNGLGVEPDIAGANGLVRVLRALLLAEMAGLAGIVGRAVAIGDKITRCGQRLLGQAQGVGTHIGDETDGALAADVDALIELLRNGHRAARRHIELAGGLLLQRGGDERRRRRAALFRALDARNGEFLPGDVAQDVHLQLWLHPFRVDPVRGSNRHRQRVCTRSGDKILCLSRIGISNLRHAAFH